MPLEYTPIDMPPWLYLHAKMLPIIRAAGVRQSVGFCTMKTGRCDVILLVFSPHKHYFFAPQFIAFTPKSYRQAKVKGSISFILLLTDLIAISGYPVGIFAAFICSAVCGHFRADLSLTICWSVRLRDGQPPAKWWVDGGEELSI